MKRNSLNDREFVTKELQKRIDQLEVELKKLRDQFDQERADMLRQQQEMKDNYEK